MRFTRFLLFLLLTLPFYSKAQITITAADMPFANDTFRVSTAAVSTPIDVSLTGTNYTWDFSSLVSTGQEVDSFVSVASTGFVYILSFSFGANAPNVVQKGGSFAALPQFQVTDVYNFYNRSTSNYRQVGLGGTISLVPTPLPIGFGNQDIIYHFPLNYGDQDSCNSDYGISLTGLGAYQAYQKRVNNVDGWGTVITPYGQFSCLRVVSELSGTDSLYLDTLGNGFLLPRVLTREYKWLSLNEGIPVIQINTQVLGPVEQITAIRYKDSLYVTGVQPVKSSIYKASLYPNPSTETAVLKGEYSGNGKVELLLTELSGKAIGETEVSSLELKSGIRLDQAFPGTGAGIFLIHLRGEQGTELVRWVRNH